MSRFSDELLDRVRQAAPLELVVEDYVTLKKAGKHLKALCPFHEEKTPSFVVSPETGLFYCYGCHKGGNVFTFLMEMENLPFPDAVRQIAERFGVPLPSQVASGEGADILSVNRWAAELYGRFLLAEPGGRPAREYLRGRTLAGESIRGFGLGASPDEWQFLVNAAHREGIPPGVLLEAGLAIKRRDGTGLLDRFRNRLMFPLHSPAGQVVAFAGRVLPGNPDDAKYVNSPETAAYHKSRFIYGMHQARRAMSDKGRALLVEGYFDVIRCHERGFTEAVAVSGTALSPEQVSLLRRKAPEVIVMFDGDDAGQSAAERAVGLLLEDSLPCRVACLPKGEDPDQVLQAHGAEALDAFIAKALPAVQFLVARAQKTARRDRDIVHAVGPTLARIPDPLLREEMAGELAQALGFTRDAVLASLRQVKQSRRASAPGTASHRMTAWEEQVCRHLLLRPAERGSILEDIAPSDFVSPLLRRLYEWIALHGGDLEARKVVDKIEDTALKRVATGLTVSETPLGPVEKDVMRFKIEKLVRAMREVRQRIEAAESNGASREVQALLAELTDLGATVDGLRCTLSGMSSLPCRPGS
ncbi:DNA primase [Candidatus Fermentibacteria bacterium]|nr:DNA primase [Candidatus Fermentibacteria bacterium]